MEVQECMQFDKLEDELIDNPDASTKKELIEHSFDETFQKKLNDRANEISSESYDSLILDASEGKSKLLGSANSFVRTTKKEVMFEYTDVDNLKIEIDDWFCSSDLDMLRLNETEKSFRAAIDGQSSDPTGYITTLLSNFQLERVTLDHLLYFLFGECSTTNSIDEQLKNISANVSYLHKSGFTEKIIFHLKIILDNNLKFNSDQNEKQRDFIFFALLTLTYFIITTILTDYPVEKERLKNALIEVDFLDTLMKFIEYSKWNQHPKYRLRNVFAILWKVILIQLGGTVELENTETFVNILYETHGQKIDQFTCSPMTYSTFKEDVLDKYPLVFDDCSNSPHPSSSSSSSSSFSKSGMANLKSDNHNNSMALFSTDSIVNYMPIPHPNRSHSASRQLPFQHLHISSPVTSTKRYADNFISSDRSRKSYQLNQACPFIYPQEYNMEIPYSLKESNEIFLRSVHDTYSEKMFRRERENFMKNERAYMASHSSKAEDVPVISEELMNKFPHHKKEIKSLLLVEDFYRSNFTRLNSIVETFMSVLKSSTCDLSLHFAEVQLNNSNSYVFSSLKSKNIKKEELNEIILQNLELIRMKETSLKNLSNVIYLLSRWFKVSHVLKFYYFTSLLYDKNYFSIAFNYLLDSFNNQNLKEYSKGDTLLDKYKMESQNRLMNPQIFGPGYSIFHNCPLSDENSDYRYCFINQKPLDTYTAILNADNTQTIRIDAYNKAFGKILFNLLSISDFLLIKKSCQRIFSINELKLTDFFRLILNNYDNAIWRLPILKILKKLIPYQGRKWKSMNMDLISMVFLHLQLSLKDDWLSGRDLENDYSIAYEQEAAVRSITKFYHIEHYLN